MDIIEVVKTTYDGYYVAKTSDGKYFAYEGLALCPPEVKDYIEKNDIKEVASFNDEAIKYNYV